MRNFKDINLQFERFKTHIIIIVLTFIFLLVGFVNFIWVKDKMISLINQNQKLIADNVSYSINSWIKDRVLETEKIATLISYSNILDDQNTTATYLSKIYEFSKEFDTVQLFMEDGTIYVGNIGKDNKDGDTEFIKSTKWYQNTKKTLGTTVNLVQKHMILNTQTLNICSPILTNGAELSAIICGILRTDEIFKKIKNPVLSEDNVYYFLANSGGKIISEFGNTNEVNFKNYILEQNQTSNFINFLTEKYGVTISKIEGIDLMVGVLSNKDEILSKNTGELFKKSAFVLIGFLLLVFVANLLHDRWYKKILAKQNEFEAMLNQSHKMAESGELIASISHQLRQPLNSVSLMISSLLQNINNEKLNSEILQSSLKLGEKSLQIMDDTITVFRNFYSQKNEISEFQIVKTIDKISHILHIELSRHNIQIIKNVPKNLSAISYENYVLQIFLVLFQNSKQALNTKFGAQSPEKKIFIDAFWQDGYVIIEVSDYGSGVSDEISKKLFKTSGITDKKSGSGLGLYIAKKIAVKKLNGDLWLKNSANPTIFALKIENLKEENDRINAKFT